MTSNEFKSDVVKILKKLSDDITDLKRIALNNNNEFLSDEEERYGSSITVAYLETTFIVSHDGDENNQIDLEEAFDPEPNIAIGFTTDDTSIYYSIQGENAINAEIQDKYLIIPSTDNQLSGYDLPIRISSEAFGEEIYQDVTINLIFE